MKDTNTPSVPITVTNWNSGQPDPNGVGQCLTFMRESTTRTAWNEMPCGKEKNYICEKRF